MIRIAKEGLRIEGVIDVRMEIIFWAIIVGDGAANCGRVIEETGNDGGSNDGGIVGRNLRDFHEAGLSLKKNMKSGRILAGDHGIGFPMAELSALVDEIGSLVNADAAWDRKGVRTARKGSFTPAGMSAC